MIVTERSATFAADKFTIAKETVQV